VALVVFVVAVAVAVAAIIIVLAVAQCVCNVPENGSFHRISECIQFSYTINLPC
jgi:hypothetical protein